MRLSQQTVIVTGAGSGIGRASARLFAAEGANTICVDVRSAIEAAEEIRASGGTAVGEIMDVTDEIAWQSLVESVASRYGRIDALANIAGIEAGGADTVLEVTREEWERVISTNLTAVWLAMRAVIPGMIAHGRGKIVNVASVASIRGLAGLAAYSASKGGVEALTRQAATEYAPNNILVNAVAPGVIHTPILGDISEDMVAGFLTEHLIKRMGRPEEVAGLMLYLLADDGDFITGQVYPIDGGWTAA